MPYRGGRPSEPISEQRTGPAPLPTRRAFLAGTAACAACAAGVGWAFERRRRPHATAPVAPADLAAERFPAPTRTLAERRHIQPDGLFSVLTTQPVVGLSFDDGPDPAHTPEVLRLLDRHHFTATFFLVGINGRAYPNLIADQLRDGHTIGNHTFHHPFLEKLDIEGVQHEIDTGEAALVAAGAPRPNLFRPPRGYTDTAIDVIADTDRYRTVFWSDCVEAAVTRGHVEADVRRLLDFIRPGSIILAHDGGHILTPGYPRINRQLTMEALPHLFRGLTAMGLRGVSIPELLRAAEPGRR